MTGPIVVTGSRGMLGSALMEYLSELDRPTVGLDLAEAEPSRRIDLADEDRLRRQTFWKNASLVIHLAGATDVDRCESDPSFAHRMNATATRSLARVCAENDLPLVYMSTAMVLGGKPKPDPYTEDDPVAPANEYARSKWAGEEAVREATPRHFIVRTAWLMGGAADDKKFVGKIVRQIQAGQRTIIAVSDKRGSPTYTVDLARNLVVLADSGRYGTYHMAGHGACTRYDMARFIRKRLGGSSEIEPAPSSRFPLPAPRPESEALRNKNLETSGLDRMRPWQEALEEYLEILKTAR